MVLKPQAVEQVFDLVVDEVVDLVDGCDLLSVQKEHGPSQQVQRPLAEAKQDAGLAPLSLQLMWLDAG